MKEFTIELSVDPEPRDGNPALIANPNCQCEWDIDTHNSLLSQLKDCDPKKIIEYADIKIPNDNYTFGIWKNELIPLIRGKNIKHLEIQNNELIHNRSSKKYQNTYFIKCLNELVRNVNYINDFNIHIRVVPTLVYSLDEFDRDIGSHLKIGNRRFVGWVYNNTYSLSNKIIRIRGKEIPLDEEYIGEISFNKDIELWQNYKTYTVRE